jgi:hypothetical protein
VLGLSKYAYFSLFSLSSWQNLVGTHFQSGLLTGIIDHVGQHLAIEAYRFPME